LPFLSPEMDSSQAWEEEIDRLLLRAELCLDRAERGVRRLSSRVESCGRALARKARVLACKADAGAWGRRGLN
jgi:hypothetical protein